VRQTKGSGDVMENENNRSNNRHSAIKRVCYDTGSPIIMSGIIRTSDIRILIWNPRTRANIVALRRRRTAPAIYATVHCSSPRPHATARFPAAAGPKSASPTDNILKVLPRTLVSIVIS